MSRWTTIAPINPDWRGLHFRLPDSLDLGCDVRLIRRPEWATATQTTRNMSWLERTRFIGAAKFALCLEYDADSLGDPDPTYGGDEPRGKQDSAAEVLRRANLALWLARPSWLGFRIVLDGQKDDGDWLLRRAYQAETVRPFTDDADNKLSHDDIALAKRLAESLPALSIESAPWRALMLLWKALTEAWWENRYLLLWVALEALFGSSSPAETTYRLSQRLALFIADDRAGARAVYDRAKAGYGARSRVVHGFRHRSLGKEKANRLLADSELLLRTALVKILLSATNRRTFSDDGNREQFLDGLIFEV